MAGAKRTKASNKKNKVSLSKKIANFFIVVSRPIRENKIWIFLRRTILKSPFRGYFVSSWRELKKVEWPNRKTSWKLTALVMLFSVLFSVMTASLDVGFEKIAKLLFLK